MNQFLQTKKIKCSKCNREVIVSSSYNGKHTCRYCNPLIVISCYTNGVTSNPKEYVLNENGDIMKFATKKDAKLFLLESGYKQEDIEHGIYIEKLVD